MRTVLILIAVAVAVTGCASLTKEAQRNLVSNGSNAERVDLAAIQAGQIQKLLSSATSNVDKGFRFQDAGKDVVRLTDGSILHVDVPTPNGVVSSPVYSEWSTEVSLSSYADLVNGLTGLQLEVGKVVELTGNAGFSTIPKRDGLTLRIESAGGSVTNAPAISALKAGQAANRTAGGEAVEKIVTATWAGRALIIGESVALVKAGGEVAVGIIEAVNPVAGAVGVARVVLEDGTTEVVKEGR